MKELFLKTQRRLFLEFIRFLLPYWKKEAVILSLGGITVILGLVNPYFAKLAIDRAFGNKDLKMFVILALAGGAVFILNGLVEGLKNYLDRQIKIKVNFDLNKKVFKHLEKLDLDYFKDKSTGAYLYRTSYDIDRVTDLITSSGPQVIATIPKVLFIFIIVLWLNWQMAVFSLCLAPFLYLLPYYFAKKRKKIWEDLFRNYENIFKRLNEFFSHIYLVKAFARETSEVRGYLRMKIANIRISMRNTGFEVISGFSSSTANKIAIGLITFYGGYEVIKGGMTLGAFTAIMIYIGQMINLQGAFAQLFENMAQGFVSCQRVEEFLDKRSRIIEKKDAQNVLFKKGGIIFKDVSFGYRQNVPVLSGMGLSIEGGSCVALVGASGCGKTTALNLILRLYEPESGDIMIDGYNIRDLSLSSLKGQIGMVLQEPFLWNDTIENNIKYGKPGASRQEIIDAAEVCGVDGFVKRLSEGYGTVIGENGCKISEGQKQKIALARAVIKKPKILILDEAMSSMDSLSEDDIMLKIKQMPEISTVIVVSHRLSTVMSVDLAYFFKKPDKITVAKPLQLIEEDKEFNDLFAAQMEGHAQRPTPE
jgi:ABC-type bacteriocin/lantibiotic exporter with double-glycine peptidase domain